jgi:hypothetical protein
VVDGVVERNAAIAAIELDDLADVNAPAPNDDDVLTWDDVAGEWIAAPAAGGGGGATLIATLTNKAGAATVVGYVYRLDPDNNDSFDYASENEDAQVIVATSVIADAASGSVVLAGYTDVYVNGTTIRGQFLYFSATSGQAKPSWQRLDGALAQATAARAGAGLVKAYVFPRERTPFKWQWHNEEGNRAQFNLPICGQAKWVSEASPILTAGAAADWDQYMGYSNGLAYEDNEVILMYGGSQDVGSIDGDLGIATCPTPLGTFTKITTGIGGTSKVLVRGGAGAWDSYYLRTPSILYDRESGLWKCWYLGNNHVTVGLGYATATDPKAAWTKYGATGQLTAPTGYVALGNVFKFCGAYYMTYGDSSYNILLAESSDGITWTYRRTLLASGGVIWSYVNLFINVGTAYLFHAINLGAPNYYTDIHLKMAPSFVIDQLDATAITWVASRDNPVLARNTYAYNSLLVQSMKIISWGRTFYGIYLAQATAANGGLITIGRCKITP